MKTILKNRATSIKIAAMLFVILFLVPSMLSAKSDILTITGFVLFVATGVYAYESFKDPVKKFMDGM